MDQRNLLLAVLLSLGILLTFEMFFAPKPPPPPPTSEQAETTGAPSPQEAGTIAPPGSPAATGRAVGLERAAALAESPRVTIESPTLRGSISLKGARIDDLTLIRYRETVEPNSPKIELLHPLGAERPYYVDLNWVSAQSGVALPTSETLWQSDHSTLSPGNPVTLFWDNGQGLRFEQTFSLDEHYMFTTTQRVVNSGDGSVSLSPYGLISRTGTPEVLGFYILHEGLLGVFNNTLKEIDYDDLQDDGIVKQSTTGGWLGITDKYWLWCRTSRRRSRHASSMMRAAAWTSTSPTSSMNHWPCPPAAAPR